MKVLYSKLKVFNYPEKLASLPRESAEILPPLHIRLKPTNVCNHRCSYCAYRADGLSLGKDMLKSDAIPREKMLEILHDIIEMKVQAVTFSGGGEPFCYPHFLETVETLAASPVKFACITNGAMLKGKIAELFASQGSWLRVSLDGWDDASYSKYRKVALGEFSRVMANLKAFKALKGSCYLGVVIITDQTNAAHVYELISMLHDTGANSVKIAPCIISNDAAESAKYHEPIFAGVKEQIAKAITDFAGPAFEVHDSYQAQLGTFEKDYDWCPFLQVVPVIGADLNVYTCHDKAYDLDSGLLGSIRDRRFKDFWLSEKSKFFRINPSKHCRHHCMVHENNKLVLNYLSVDRDHIGFV